MTTIRTHARVDSQGKVRLVVPFDPDDAGTEVMITISPLGTSTASPQSALEQWLDELDRTAGSIDDPTFERPQEPAIAPVPEF